MPLELEIDSANFGTVDDFNFKDITNGGANRFWYDQKNDVLKIAGSDVGGRESYDDINAFLTRAADLYDGAFISGQQQVKYDGSGELGYSIQGENDNIVKFGPDNHNGATRIEFENAQDAQNFLDLVNVLDDMNFI